MRSAPAACVYLGNFLPAAKWLYDFKGPDLKAVVIEDLEDAADLVRWTRERNIPCLRVTSSEILDEAIHSVGPLSWGLCVNFGLILSPLTLGRFTLGVLNVHPGLLPEQAGRDPVSRQWEDPRRRFGVTLHWMTSRVDAGPVLDCQECSPGFRPDTPARAVEALYLMGLNRLSLHRALFA